MRLAAAGTSILIAALVSPGARAHDEPEATEPNRYAWRFGPGSECVPPPGLHLRIAELVGVPEPALKDKLHYLGVDVSRREQGWSARLKVATPAGSGERTFEAESCAALVDGTVLIVALAVDPNLRLPNLRLPAPRVTRPSPEPPPQLPPATRSRTVRAVMRPLAAADLGVLPGATFGFGLAAGVVWPRWRIELDGTAHPWSSVVQPSWAGGELRVLARAGARACRVGERGRLALDVCLGAAAASIRGTGRGITDPATDEAMWLAVTAGVAGGVRLAGWLWLRAELLGGLSAVRPSFRIEGVGEIYRPSVMTGRVAIGVETRF